jgi:hypothetical protein
LVKWPTLLFDDRIRPDGEAIVKAEHPERTGWRIRSRKSDSSGVFPEA